MRKVNKRNRFWRLGGMLALGLSVAGCQTPTHTAGDPLLGPAPANPNVFNGTSTTPAKAQNEAPAVPTAQNNNTPAGLANNTNLPGARPLTIGEGGNNPNWQLTNLNKDAPNKTPTVIPVPRETPPPQGGLVPSSWSDSAPTVENGLAALKARGAVGEQQERLPDGVRFSCFVPSRANPANLRQYEVTAPDLTAAVQAVLRQIDGAN